LADGFLGRPAGSLAGLDPPANQLVKEIRQIAFVICFFDFGVNPREKDLIKADSAIRFASLDQHLYLLVHLVQAIDQP
jgi:hypothetical protein